MKKILSILLCAAMLFTTLAAAPANGLGHLCDSCRERGCTEAGHIEGCPCAAEEDGCEACAKSVGEADGENADEDSTGNSSDKSDEGGGENADSTDPKTEVWEDEDSAEDITTLEANGEPTTVADNPTDIGSFKVTNASDESYEYSDGVLTIKAGTVTVSGNGSGLKIEAGANVTVSGLTISSASGAAIENNGVLTISGPVMLHGSPSAVSGADPTITSSFTHLTYGGSEAVEWTGSSAAVAWGSYEDIQIQDMQVNSLEVSPASASVAAGKTQEFTATLKVTAGGKAVDLDVTKDATWSVDPSSPSSIGANTGILNVNDNETAEKLTVTAKYTAGTEYAKTATVTVLFPAKEVSLDKSELTLGVGDSVKLTATIKPANTYDVAKWSVSPEGVISVDQNGNIKALAKGEATITVTAGSAPAVTCKVTVVAKNYTVTFDPDGGVCKTKEATTKDDGTLGAMPTATKEGLYFAGWYTAKNGKGTRVYANTVLSGDITLYARWSTVPVTGDENNAVIWAALLGVSALAICAGGVYFFRKGRKGKDQTKGE